MWRDAVPDNVIYFPSIDVPETPWFTQALLYWDSVGTIVPSAYDKDRSYLRPYTQDLLNRACSGRSCPTRGYTDPASVTTSRHSLH